MTGQADERYVVTRTIAADASTIFAILADPARHKDTEPGDWVRDAVDVEPITGTGQIFAMNMNLDAAGGDYVVHNLVTEFDPIRAIAWRPGQVDEAGQYHPGGWIWRYELAPNGTKTDVTLTYDWSHTSQEFREQVAMPMFGQEFIEDSLATLDRTVTGR